ncbi:CRISPR-associated endoribonuclease Cas6 [Hydrogenivirga sp. 128-5-R1-1]|uniref:CRISPR-associated endoribonuclease Cas6 n=1 Tax=Hydrogenivirga sp. 128-5-R1-1 TaxID=392423 RepID=UPI00015F18BF|nr:CRISPR-associated endoribonuclease Cas6 [Hydrogenivirga sp. 128-5-R1-1]EDP75366.1 hypothetical protein HG1285_15416 [Hydrogenivirga sp. 128-5-R1-1]
MIVKINLIGEEAIALPKSYNHILQAFFYSNMDPVLSKFLHDIGFTHGKRRFKLFTFSKVIGKITRRDKRRGFVFFSPDVTLYFASPLIDIVSSSVKTFLKRGNLFLGRNTVSLSSIELVKPEVDGEMTVRCLSPITVYRTPKGEKRFQYLSPWQDEFYELLRKNLVKKYELVYSKSYKGELEIEPVKVIEGYRKKVLYRGTLVEAWEGYYKLKGNEDMLRLALEAGLGAKNSQGFGMVERVL